MELGILLECVHAVSSACSLLPGFQLCSAVSAGEAGGGRELTEMEAWAVVGS